MPKKQKKQQTEWIWHAKYSGGTSIKVGWIHNKQRGVLEDRIRVKITGEHSNFDFNMRLDEAACLVAGIGKTICIQALHDRIQCVP